METMDNQCYVFLGIKVKPGPIERYRIENFTLDNTVDTLKCEAQKKANIPSASLELIHHGKILKDKATLQDSGVKIGEMVHVVKKKPPVSSSLSLNFSEAELIQLNASLRSLGCTPTAPGWTRAMQLLNDESAMAEIMDHAPTLADDCVTLSLLHEVELLAALGANAETMRRGVESYPDLVIALRHLMRLVHNRSSNSGLTYAWEVVSEEEDPEEEVVEEGEDGEGRGAITQEQLAAALQAVTEAVLSPARGGHEGLLRLLQAAGEPGNSVPPAPAAVTEPPTTGAPRAIITAEMFSEAITDALNRTAGVTAGGTAGGTPFGTAGETVGGTAGETAVGTGFGTAGGTVGGAAGGTVGGAAGGTAFGTAVGTAFGTAVGTDFGTAGETAIGTGFGTAGETAVGSGFETADDTAGDTVFGTAGGTAGQTAGWTAGQTVGWTAGQTADGTAGGGTAFGTAGETAAAPACGTAGGIAFGAAAGPAFGTTGGTAAEPAFGTTGGTAFGTDGGTPGGTAGETTFETAGLIATPVPILVPTPSPSPPMSDVEPSTSAVTPMEQSSSTPSPMSSPTAGPSSGFTGTRRPRGSRGPRGEFEVQLHRMHELGLLDDAINVRALQICSGDVIAAINLVFSEIIGDGI